MGSQWTIITGLRGVGKTTILAQLYQHINLPPDSKFFISLDEIYAAGTTMTDVISVIEHRFKSKILDASKPIAVFLDEVHFLPRWLVAAKVLYDNSRRLFLVCTGSSSISFWGDPDIGRRSEMISIPPLSFQEYIHFENLYTKGSINLQLSAKEHQTAFNLCEAEEQSIKLRQIIFGADSIEEIVEKLKKLRLPSFNDKNQIQKYINFYGSMPYAAPIKHKHGLYKEEIHFNKLAKSRAEKEIKDRVLHTINILFLRGLEILGNFDTATKNKFIRLLLLLANADNINLRKIAKNLNLNILTVQNMLQALKIAEIIIPIAPAGSSLGKIAKPYKYLFNGSALRLAISPILFNSSEKIDSQMINKLRGHLLEDIIAMYLHRLFINQPLPGVLEYDVAAGGADFIIMPRGFKTEAIVLEVGYDKTTSAQVIKTLKRFKNGRSIIVTDSKELSFDKHNKIIFLPLEIFLRL